MLTEGPRGPPGVGEKGILQLDRQGLEILGTSNLRASLKSRYRALYVLWAHPHGCHHQSAISPAPVQSQIRSLRPQIRHIPVGARFLKSWSLRCCISLPKSVMAMSSATFLILSKARCCLPLSLSQRGFSGLDMRGAVLLLPGWRLRCWIISALLFFCQEGWAMDLLCSLQKLSSSAIAQKQGWDTSNLLEGFLLSILSNVLSCKVTFCSQTVNFGSSSPSNSTHFKCCQNFRPWKHKLLSSPWHELSENQASF